jgi:hypothetical protein
LEPDSRLTGICRWNYASFRAFSFFRGVTFGGRYPFLKT